MAAEAKLRLEAEILLCTLECYDSWYSRGRSQETGSEIMQGVAETFWDANCWSSQFVSFPSATCETKTGLHMLPLKVIKKKKDTEEYKVWFGN